jgi:hypothetical protein
MNRKFGMRALEGGSTGSQSVAARDRHAGPRFGSPANRQDRFGGIEGNETLTSAAAVLLTFLLLAEGVTILRIGGLVSAHMFIGLVLIPPVLLKLSSTGYRFVRYYTGTRSYREKGPPLLPLRILAPVLVASTVIILATGVWLLLLGHRSDRVLLLHKVSFVIWGAVFAIHFLVYLPRMARSLRADWTAGHRLAVPGTNLRAMLLAASFGAGLALALSMLSLINGWHAQQHLF